MVWILYSQTLVITPELDASLHEADAIPSLVSLGFLHLVSIVSNTFDCSLLHTSNLLSYGAKLELCFCLFHRQVKCELLS